MQTFPVALAIATAVLGLGRAMAAPVVIPISVVNSHIEIPVTLNGRPMTAVLDSGAPNSEIDLSLARQSGLKIEAPAPEPASLSPDTPALSSAKGWLMDAGVLSIGGWSSREPVWVDDLGPMTAMGQSPMIIGDDLFRAFVVEIDFDARTLTLHDRAGFQPPTQATPLPVTHAGFGYATPISIEGGPAKLANLDLGANASLMLNQAYAEQLGVLGRPGSSSRGCLGLAGEQRCQTGLSVDKVQLGPFDFPKAPVVVAAADDPVFRNIDANLGLGLLSRFHIWMDFTGDRLWLAPTSHMADPYQRTLGCAFRTMGETLEAAGVVSGGPAAKAGLKSGDRIVAVDGIRGADAMTRAIEAGRSTGRGMNFELQDGRRVTVEPGDRV